MSHQKVNPKLPTKSAGGKPFFIDNAAAIGLGLMIGAGVAGISNPLHSLIIFAGIFVAGLTIFRVEWSMLLLVFITHSNLSTVLLEHHGVPSIAKILVALIILGMIVNLFIFGRQPTGWRQLTFLIVIYGAVGMTSLLFAADHNETISTLLHYTKGCVIAVIIIFLLQDATTLRRVIWAILASGILIGTIGVVQHLTGSFNSDFGGLGVSFKHHIIGEIDAYRISGTLGEPNFFALFMVPLIPLGIDRLFQEQKPLFKAIAAWAVVVSVLAVIFSYSRGGFVSLIFMLLIYIALRPRRILYALTVAIAVVPLISVTSQSNYINRMITLKNVLPGVGPEVPKEISFKGRKSEMIVATEMFMDHPILGVGLGNYLNHYQKYAHNVYMDLRREDREAHCRYLEILAETGLIGFSVFCAIIFIMFRGLWQARKIATKKKWSDLNGSITAISIGMAGILFGYIFLHDAWPRFFWMFVGIAFAAVNIVENQSGTGQINKSSYQVKPV